MAEPDPTPGGRAPRRLALLLLIAVGGCAAHRGVASSERPPDVADVVRRAEACQHFADEFGGDGSDCDREVLAEMDTLRCGEVEADAAALRRAYAGNAAVLDALRLPPDE